MLGSCLGKRDFAVKVILGRVHKIKKLVSLLSDIDDAEIEYRLLKSCIGMPKFNFALRSRHPDDIREEPLRNMIKPLWTVLKIL